MSDMSDETVKTDFQQICNNDFQNMQTKLSKHGYADGVNDGREAEFQSSFDRGYAAGILAGFELEKIKKFYETLKENDSRSLNKEKNHYQRLQLPDVETNHSNSALNEFLQSCTADLPLTTALLEIKQPN